MHLEPTFHMTPSYCAIASMGSGPAAPSVGWVTMCYWPGDECLAFLDSYGVLPDFRGAGHSLKLLEHAAKAACSHGIKCIVTYTAGWNVASNNALISAGYKTFTPAHFLGYPGGLGEGWIHWFKRLNPSAN